MRYVSYRDRKQVAVDLNPSTGPSTSTPRPKRSKRSTKPSPDDRRRVAGPLGAHHPVPRAARGAPPRGLHHEQHREPKPPDPQDDQDPRPLSDEHAATKLINLAIQRAETKWRTAYHWTAAPSELREPIDEPHKLYTIGGDLRQHQVVRVLGGYHAYRDQPRENRILHDRVHREPAATRSSSSFSMRRARWRAVRSSSATFDPDWNSSGTGTHTTVAGQNDNGVPRRRGRRAADESNPKDRGSRIRLLRPAAAPVVRGRDRDLEDLKPRGQPAPRGGRRSARGRDARGNPRHRRHTP
jgi:hypothetical protein